MNQRNIGAKNSSGDFLAFIDSDAYPRRDWLKNAVRLFSDPEVAAVGGPGVTPEEDPVLQKAGGFILSSFMVGGLANRYGSATSRESDDIHSCNFITRKIVLEEIGGWNEKYWPGEDTLICPVIENFEILTGKHEILISLKPALKGTMDLCSKKIDEEFILSLEK